MAIASRSPQQTAERLGVAAVAADLGGAEGCAHAVEQAAGVLGGIDSIVNNVGGAKISSFEDVPDERWQESWDLNVMSYVRVIRAARRCCASRRTPRS